MTETFCLLFVFFVLLGSNSSFLPVEAAQRTQSKTMEVEVEDCRGKMNLSGQEGAIFTIERMSS